MAIHAPYGFYKEEAASGLQPAQDGMTLHLSAHDSNSYPGSGTTWYDISPSGSIVYGTSRDFTLVGSPTYTTNEAFDFNGTSQYAEWGPTPTANYRWWDTSVSYPDFTFEYVLRYDKFNDGADFASIFSHWGSTSTNQSFLNMANGDNNGRFLSFIRNNATQINLFNSSADHLYNDYNGEFIHVVYRYTADQQALPDYNIKVTINGTRSDDVNWTSFTAFETSNANSVIAARDFSTSRAYFDGAIGVCRVYYNRAITDAEVTQNFNFESQYYTFD